MAVNVFGLPITKEVLEAMIEYEPGKVTQKDCAAEAMKYKTSEGKALNATEFTNALKTNYGDGVSTKVLIYNATGAPLTFVDLHNWHGHIGSSPHPEIIENGQWGAFLHVHTSGAAVGSSGGIVYRGCNAQGEPRDWLVAWHNPWNRASWDNTVYTEVRGPNHFGNEGSWPFIQDLLEGSGDRCEERNDGERRGCTSVVTTGHDTTVFVEAVLSIDHADANGLQAAAAP